MQHPDLISAPGLQTARFLNGSDCVGLGNAASTSLSIAHPGSHWSRFLPLSRYCVIVLQILPTTLLFYFYCANYSEPSTVEKCPPTFLSIYTSDEKELFLGKIPE